MSDRAGRGNVCGDQSTKEHEAVVAVNTKAFVVHSALLALGPIGQHGEIRTQVRAAHGTKIEIWFTGPTTKRATQSSRPRLGERLKTKKPMTFPWVFAGSGFHATKRQSGKYYMAEAGDFIVYRTFLTPCWMFHRKYFGNDDLMFEAFTEKHSAAPARKLRLC